jgi:hypothetical protein
LTLFQVQKNAFIPARRVVVQAINQGRVRRLSGQIAAARASSAFGFDAHKADHASHSVEAA